MDIAEDIYTNIEEVSFKGWDDLTAGYATLHMGPQDGTNHKKHNQLSRLQISYNNLTEQEQKYQNTVSEQENKISEMQILFNNLTDENHKLQNKISKKECCFQDWRSFLSGCYYLSLVGKTWSESREDCKDRGADLVIINSREEQVFLNQLGNNLHYWIGLTDSEKEGTWRWVDGTTPPTPQFWRQGEPNNAHEDENCVVFNSFTNSLGNIWSWNDQPCSLKTNWVCEYTLTSS
ncbi:C-type lectin domain family 4 member E-like isoform X2 [Esox lucius]|uniref:C-type lectin domain family 4 member E-like isoform X2 n=1 Tax=Esox lucius TaxID=8010 RepID=UPI00147784C0|nr:C-type lectin domain family 4 member E-like isoform X2 [Esox lucius]